jgi:Helix-turn-helix domain
LSIARGDRQQKPGEANPLAVPGSSTARASISGKISLLPSSSMRSPQPPRLLGERCRVSFFEVLEDTPGRYVQRLRLHRIRHELVSDGEALCTISMISRRWGISEPARMAGWYRELFGESPSETLATRLARPELL